jgi:hypothetical protein
MILMRSHRTLSTVLETLNMRYVMTPPSEGSEFGVFIQKERKALDGSLEVRSRRMSRSLVSLAQKVLLIRQNLQKGLKFSTEVR